MDVKKKVISALLAVALVLGVLPGSVPAAAAAAAETDIVALPDDGVVAAVRHWDGERIVTEEYRFANAATASREDVNNRLTDAWRKALDLSRSSSKRIPQESATIFVSCGDRVEMHIYVDWLAIDGKFNPDDDDDGFDGGELEIDGWNDAKLMLDLHGHTLDRGSTSSKKYGRILDIYNNGSTFALVSSGAMGTVTGGWDDEGGAIRSDKDCTMFFDNIHFTGNHAEKGGALYMLEAGIIHVDNCKFSGNTAKECGGAIATVEVTGTKSYTDWLYLTNSEFCDNVSNGKGGAVYIADVWGNFIVTDTKIYNNTAKSDGGGIYVEMDAKCDLKGNSAIYNNHADGDGGGIFLQSYFDYNSYVKLYDGDVYNNTAGSGTPSPSDLHLDTGIREDAMVYLSEGFSPNYPIAVVAEENGQLVLQSIGGNSEIADTVRKGFYAARSDQFLKTVGNKVYAEKFSKSDIGDITRFDCSISSNDQLNSAKPSHIEINNDTRAIKLIFPASGAMQTTLALNLEAQCTATEGSLPDYDCDGYEADGEGRILLKNDTSNSGTYRGSFLLWNSDETFSTPWVVTAEFRNDYDATLAMRVTCGGDTHPYYATDESPFRNGWNKAVELVKDGSDVTVTLYRDWSAENGSFGSGDGFKDGRISINDEKGSGTLTLDLNGCTIDRGLTKARDSGQVFRLSEKSRLMITDSSAQGGGRITGGYNTGEGGGFYVVDDAILTLENVAVSGNRAKSGGGIDLNDDSCLYIYDGAEISGNSCENTESYDDGGGGICARGDSAIWLCGGRICNNTANPKGGGIYWCSEGKLFLLGGEITGNYSCSADPNVYGGGGVMVDHYFATIYTYYGSDPYVGGTVRITDNHAGPKKVSSNITLDSKDENLNHYTDLPLAPGAMIGVNVRYDLGEDKKDCITASGSKFAADSSQYFFSDDEAYILVADSNGSGDNKYQIHLAAADEASFADSKCVITGISFGIEGENAVIDTEKRHITVTADADKYGFYTNACPTMLTCTANTSVSPAVNTRRDYTQLQRFVLTAPDGRTKQTWTVQVVPDGGSWTQYEVKVYGGHADAYLYSPGEIVTLTVDAGSEAAFGYWSITDAINGNRVIKMPQCSFIMPAADVTAEAVLHDLLSAVDVTMSGMTPGAAFADVVFTAEHDAGDGSFRDFAAVWYDENGTVVSNAAEIEANTAYGLSLALEPAVECVFSGEGIQCEMNGETVVCSVVGGVIHIDTMVVTGDVAYAAITVTDGTDPIPAYRYSLTKDGKLAAGEKATFIPEDYFDPEQNKFYQVAAVTGISDSDPLTEGWQFTVTDPTHIVVNYRALTTIGEIALVRPAVTPGESLPAALTLPAGVELVSLTWEPADPAAGYAAEYTASAVLKPADGCIFGETVDVTFREDLDQDGADDVFSCAVRADGTLTVSFRVSTGKDRLTGVTVPSDVTIPRGAELSLPEMVAVTTAGGSVHALDVVWQTPDGFSTDLPGTYTFTGRLCLPDHVELGAGMSGQITLTVAVTETEGVAVPGVTTEQKDMDGRRCTVLYLHHEASIFYTIGDAAGSEPADPTASSAGFPEGGIVLRESGTYRIKAIAMDGSEQSDVVEYTFTVTVPNVYTLHHKVWIDNGYDESKTTTVTAVEGETCTITAESLAGKAFIGHVIDTEGDFADNRSVTFVYTMPAENVTINSVYVTLTDAVELSGIDAPVAYMAFDNLATASVSLPYGNENPDALPDVVSHRIVVTWKDSQGNAVTRAEYGKTYTGTITLKDRIDSGVVFADSVTVTGVTDAAAVRSGDQLVITFAMTAGMVNLTQALELAPDEALVVETGTAAESIPLPATLNVPTAAGDVPVDVTWSCEGYDAAAAGEYDFTAAFDLAGAGVANPYNWNLSAAIRVVVSSNHVKLPTANVAPGVYFTNQTIELAAEPGAEIWYTLNDGAETKYDGAIALTGEAGQTKTFTIKAYAKTADRESARATFQYTIKLPVTVTVTGGTLADGTTSGTFRPGEQATVVASGLTAYHIFTGWTASGITIAEESRKNPSYTFAVPANDVAVTAGYECKQVDRVEIDLSAPAAGQPLAASGRYSLYFTQAGVAPVGNAVFTPVWNPDENARLGGVYTMTFTLPAGYDLAESVAVAANGAAAEWDASRRTVRCTFPAVTDAYASHADPAAKTNVAAGTKLADLLPETVVVTTAGGTTAEVKVDWHCDADAALAGGDTVTVVGALNGVDLAQKHITGGENAKVSMVISANMTAVAAPTAVPAAGNYRGSVAVSLHCVIGGAAIYYTTDGTTPTTASARYTGPIPLTADAVIKAVAVKEDMADSAVAEFHYTVTPLYTVTVVNGTGSGKYAEGETITLRANTYGDKYFIGWTRDDGTEIISTAPALLVTVGDADVTYTATYADSVQVVHITVPPVSVGDDLPGKEQMEITDGVEIDTVVWNSDGKVKGNTLYTAAITISAAGRGFAEHGTVYVNGTQVRSVRNADHTVTLTYQVITGALQYADCSFDDSPITNVAWNTALEAMGLPTTATVTTADGSKYAAAIAWDLKGCSYEQGAVDDQTFTVSGVVVLPTGIAGSDPQICITVSVNGLPVAPPHSPSVTPAKPQPSDDGPCSGGPDCPCCRFRDLDPNAWYHEAVDYVLTEGMMQGYTDGTFGPGGTTTRAMIVTILWRLEGCPAADEAVRFGDVASDQWFTEAVRWAAGVGLVGGYGDGSFGPMDSITREQLAAILYRYEQYKGGGFVGSWMFPLDFVDKAALSDWAYEAMCWMNMNEIINGKPGGALDPKGHATRAESAAMLQRYCLLTTEGD